VADSSERKGFSTATKALMDASKVEALGWTSEYTITSGLKETIELLREVY